MDIETNIKERALNEEPEIREGENGGKGDGETDSLTPNTQHPTSNIQQPTPASRELLRAGALEFGIKLDDHMLDEFDAFTVLLLEWNEKFNLTRITDPEEIAVKHYLDSIAMLKYVEMQPGSRLIDVGTGAGMPGIPLKIAVPSLRLTLMDSLYKRVNFLKAVVEELGLKGVESIHSRAEDLGRNKLYRGQFEYVTSRAVAKMNVLCELCMPLLRVGGRFIAFKGPQARAEIAEANVAIRSLGGELEIAHEYTLPNTDQGRTLVVVKKTRPTTHHYPRTAGLPEKSPIK